jgi:hypothetical protein
MRWPARFRVERDFRVPENPWHHFFVGRAHAQ